MSLMENLIDDVKANIDLLQTLDESGDVFSTPREVDFLFYAKDMQHAEDMADFLNSYQFAKATAYDKDGRPAVAAMVHAVVQQHGINCISGFMLLLGKLHGLEYDGWGCVAQRKRD